MDLKGSITIAADRMTVWAALNDAEILRASIPGCTAMTGDAQSGFTATVTQKIGPVKATFKGTVIISDVVEGYSYQIAGHGKAGPAGYAHGSASVTLEDAGGATRLSYEVTAKVGGKIAALGARLIDGIARQLADKFFENLQNAVETEDEADQDAEKLAQPGLLTQPGILGKIWKWLKGILR